MLPGRPLERVGNGTPRWMVAQSRETGSDRIRRTSRLATTSRLVGPPNMAHDQHF